MPEILGTEKGIEALAEFLEKSGAFTKTGRKLRPRSAPKWEEEPEPQEEQE